LLSSTATGIFLHENYLEGPIPSELGLLSNLDSLWLHLLALTGTVPAEVCRLFETGNLQVLAIDCLKIECSCGCSCPTESEPELGLNALAGHRTNSGKSHLGSVLTDPVFADPIKKVTDITSTPSSQPPTMTKDNIFNR
jgi:hypothetical protein